MRIGNVLWLMRTNSNIPFRLRGKNRKVRPPTLKVLVELRKDFEREERNMLILRHPYLTPQQSHGHMIAFKDTKRLPAQSQMEERNSKFSRNFNIMRRLRNLRMFEGWE